MDTIFFKVFILFFLTAFIALKYTKEDKAGPYIEVIKSYLNRDFFGEKLVRKKQLNEEFDMPQDK